jgi:hypothetical protein
MLRRGLPDAAGLTRSGYMVRAAIGAATGERKRVARHESRTARANRDNRGACSGFSRDGSAFEGKTADYPENLSHKSFWEGHDFSRAARGQIRKRA